MSCPTPREVARARWRDQKEKPGRRSEPATGFYSRKATVKFLEEFFGVVPEATSFFNTEGREFVVVVAEAAVA